MASSGGSGSGGGGSPCGACKFLRRKCAPDCIFAPYFCSEQGPARFAVIHKVFGASNVSKLLMMVPVPDRCEAVVTIAYEAQARLRDPVYGCVAHIFSLQQQVTCLQAQLMQVKAQLAHHNLMDTRNVVDQQHHHQWPNMMITDHHHTDGSAVPSPSNFPMMNMNMNNNMMSSVSSQSSHESHNSTSCSTGFNSNNVQAENVNDQSSSSSRRSSRSDQELSNFLHQSPYNYNNATASTTTSTKKRPLNNDLGELQALALRMMRN